ncbi:MAG TPA: carbamoyl-phosphate synthase large subunit [Candidatus Acutalibacter pullicola]|uniref:Multifunctional fusion protein n=1 Tax=Candidatus Acutalibacter pullicola TaxID=2838417 RepID=A0A9D2MV17_9FIRM|nr:carbamoyl-phosphate synthase large subunit [Candidatus Acutalibacter pullicola]
MPLNKDIKKVLVIGSGPIVIGQAAEFDYAGTQACRALRDDGIEIVLVNSNPATIMTDKAMADKIYIEPLTLTTVKRIIEKEKPDSILSGFGGQTGLTLSMQLAKEGFLESHNVRLLGASPETIDKAEDRQMFKDTMEKIGQPCIPSKVVTTVEDAEAFAQEIGYPVIIRPAFTLGGSGGGIVNNQEELREVAANGLALSPITQILVEKSIAGWKEIEFEVMRDSKGNTITVCSMENLDPVGVHTGDSIVIAPTVTLSDKEYQMLRSAALKIIDELGVEGGCNCQFALHPTSFEYAVIEVNPRVSRSSALASKATGYPIAKVATKIAIGYTLDEIKNAVTGKTYAAFEPALDYVAVKFPKWPFDKFVYAKRDLGTQMKATGEVMSIADTFEMALMKAVRGAEISLDTLNLPKFATETDENLWHIAVHATDERLFAVYELLKRGVTVEKMHEETMIDCWFLSKILNLLNYERELQKGQLTQELYTQGKKLGYPDSTIARLSGCKVEFERKPTFKMVDTCAGEFAAHTPYFYATYDTEESGGEDEALEFIGEDREKQTVIVLGSGPIRIGQGIEFDYASVHCVMSLRQLGYEVVIINNNPETVSTDFDTGDRLYFEPLSPEDVMDIIKIEKPIGVVVAFGGQTAIKLTKTLAANNIPILGSSADTIDMAEDRERFDELLERSGIKRPKGHTIMTTEEALDAARDLGYPVLMRPSYVLGGQNMIIAYCDEDIQEYMAIILSHKQDNPVLIDKYLSGMEIEVDAICDGENILIPGIMEHVERTGIHSGDSIAVYPASDIDDDMSAKIVATTETLCRELNALGLINLQYIIMDGEIYVIEVNPRASRTVPYISKVTGVPMCDLATKVSLGYKLTDLGFGTGLYKPSPYVAVKVPVFSFEKLTDVDTHLGPEMKSTGEVLGIGNNVEEALYKGLIASGHKMNKGGGVFITVRDQDKPEIGEIAKKFAKMGFELYATTGTAMVLFKVGLSVKIVDKIHESSVNTITLLESGKVNYVISTSAKGRNPARDSVKIRRKASLLGIPCLTAIDTANALADSLMSRYTPENTEIIDINNLKTHKQKLKFTKMSACSNDYIYINLFDPENTVSSPEFLSIYLSDRHNGVGGDGVILICPSDKADAEMRMFNLDGSEGLMCGNGIRCVAKYLFDNGIAQGEKVGEGRYVLHIDTRSGVKECTVITKNGLVSKVTVDMGKAELAPDKVPVRLEGERVVDKPISIDGDVYRITCCSMGNPHCTVFVPSVDKLDLENLGPKFENDPMFPERVNVGFVEVIDDHTLKARIWERGSGETMACGTGTCAAVVAATLNGYCEKGRDIRVILKGGELKIHYTDDRVLMTGKAEKIYDGVVEV